MITRSDVVTARERITGRVRQTPVIALDVPDRQIWLKCEFMQVAGVFKTRGAFNRLLAARERQDLDPTVGVVIASGGNAGLATAFAAAQVEVPATVFLPESAPPVKIARLRRYGAHVHLVGQQYGDTYDAAVMFASTTGALLSHAYDQPRSRQVRERSAKRLWSKSQMSTPSSSPLEVVVCSPELPPQSKAGRGSWPSNR